MKKLMFITLAIALLVPMMVSAQSEPAPFLTLNDRTITVNPQVAAPNWNTTMAERNGNPPPDIDLGRYTTMVAGAMPGGVDLTYVKLDRSGNGKLPSNTQVQFFTFVDPTKKEGTSGYWFPANTRLADNLPANLAVSSWTEDGEATGCMFCLNPTGMPKIRLLEFRDGQCISDSWDTKK